MSDTTYGKEATAAAATGPAVPPPQPMTFTTWLIVVIAVIGFAFDTYELLVMPLINRPALAELLHVDRYTDAGTQAILNWSSYITWSSAVCGGVFGLLGGWLTDRFGRRTVLTWSILLFAVSALLSGFSTSALMLLILRCTTFIGVCVEFVAAVAWLAELFPNPKQRESVLGYTQAFSSFGGMLATGSYLLINLWAASLPNFGLGEDHRWRWTLISGVIPALPLIFIRPFLPESPAWLQKRRAGTLKRPNVLDLFRAGYMRTSIVTALLFACGFATAFGALQLTPQMVPGLYKDTLGRARVQALAFYEAAKAAKAADGGNALALLSLQRQAADPADKAKAERASAILKDAAAVCRETGEAFKQKLADLKKRAADAQAANAPDADMLERASEGVQANASLGKAIGFTKLAKDKAEKAPNDKEAQATADEMVKHLKEVGASVKDPEAFKDLHENAERATTAMEEQIAGVQMFQEIGGLVGRFVLAFLATVIVSRRLLLWLFQVPGLLLIPLVYFFPAAGRLPADNVEWLKAGVFLAGFLTIAQFSFWGNYLPRVYPTHLRGTGESFAANIGGRMLGTSGQFLAAILVPVMLFPGLDKFGQIAYAAAFVVIVVYALGCVLTFFLPQPKEVVAQE